MTADQDPYAILGVSPTSDDVVIRAAFKALMLKYHPDTNKSEDATARAAAINEAFAVLGDPVRRAHYDGQPQRRDQSKQAGARSAPPPPPPPPTPPPPGSTEAPKGVNLPLRSWQVVAGVVGTLSIALLNAFGGPTTETVKYPVLTDNSMIVDMNATNSVGTLNDVTTTGDTAPSFREALANLNTASETGFPAISVPAYQGSQTALSYQDIETGARNFAKVLLTSGIAGAKAYSSRCHANVKKEPSWSAADRCAAFDIAGAAVDASFSRQNGTPPDGYFAFESANAQDQYQDINVIPASVYQRIQAIRNAAEPAAAEALRTRTAARRPTSQLSAPQAIEPAWNTDPPGNLE